MTTGLSVGCRRGGPACPQAWQSSTRGAMSIGSLRGSIASAPMIALGLGWSVLASAQISTDAQAEAEMKACATSRSSCASTCPMSGRESADCFQRCTTVANSCIEDATRKFNQRPQNNRPPQQPPQVAASSSEAKLTACAVARNACASTCVGNDCGRCLVMANQCIENATLGIRLPSPPKSDPTTPARAPTSPVIAATSPVPTSPSTVRTPTSTGSAPASPVSAQSGAAIAYPTRPVVMRVSALSERSGLVAKALGDVLTVNLGQRFTVEEPDWRRATAEFNRAYIQDSANAPADGYTLLVHFQKYQQASSMKAVCQLSEDTYSGPIVLYAPNGTPDPILRALDSAAKTAMTSTTLNQNVFDSYHRPSYRSLLPASTSTQVATSAGPKACNSPGQFSAAPPIPVSGRGIWWVWSVDRRTPYLGNWIGGQEKAASDALSRCRMSGSAQCISIGGCTGGVGAVAASIDGTWAWVACGTSEQAAMENARSLCELKMGCPCDVVRTSGVP